MDNTTRRNLFPPEYALPDDGNVAEVPVGTLPVHPALAAHEDLRVEPPLFDAPFVDAAVSHAKLLDEPLAAPFDRTGSRPVTPPPPPLEHTASRAIASGAGDPPAEPDPTFATRLPTDHPGLRLDRPQGRSLRRGPIFAIAAVVTTILVVAVAAAFSPKDQAHAATPNLPEEPQTKNVPISDTVQNAPTSADELHPPPKLGPPLHGADQPDQQAAAHPRAAGGGGFGQPSARQAIREEREKAFASPILVDVENPSAEPGSSTLGAGVAALAAAAGAPATKSDSPAAPLLGGAGTGDPNMQQHKSDFLSRDGVNTSTYLSQPVVMPRSPFEVKAGTIIPATLLTAINSDLPGQIIGQVRENVYDTVTGNYLIIPQGSKLLATYDSAVSYGQERVLFCWNRIIRPDGISISLECMPGADLAGASGATDDVNHHWWRIITGVALGTLLSATAERAAGNPTGYQPTITQSWAANAGGAVNSAGQQITQKNLAIQPTITVRAGYSVNVIVTKDITFPPYARPAMP
jgi:type IV secretory pathway VirB10-like protein